MRHLRKNFQNKPWINSTSKLLATSKIHLQQTVVEPEIRINHSYDFMIYEKGFTGTKLLDQGLKFLFMIDTNAYIYAANWCFWEEIYRLNHASLQSMGK